MKEARFKMTPLVKRALTALLAMAMIVTAVPVQTPGGGSTVKKVSASAVATYLLFNPNGGSLAPGENFGHFSNAQIDGCYYVKTLRENQTDYRYMREAIPTRTGYKFLGWFDDTSGGNMVYNSKGEYNTGVYWDYYGNWIYEASDYNTDDPYEPKVVLYAHWEANTYTVTYNANGGVIDGTTTTTTEKQQAYGDHLDLPSTPVRKGYVFNGWFTTTSGGDQVTNSTVYRNTSATTYYAHWTANACTAIFDLNYDNDNGATTTTGVCGNAIEFPDDPTRTGYTFDGWYTGPNGGKKVTIETATYIDGTITFYAHWTAKTYRVTYNPRFKYVNNYGTTYAATYGSVYPTIEGEESVSYIQTYGENLKLPSEPKIDGFTFVGWYTVPDTNGFFDYYYYDEEDLDEYKVTSATVFENAKATTYYAHWSANAYYINFKANGGTFNKNYNTYYTTYYYNYIPLLNPDYKVDGEAILSREGYAFDGWYTEPDGGDEIEVGTDESGNPISFVDYSEQSDYLYNSEKIYYDYEYWDDYFNLGDLNLYAHWTKEYETVTYDFNGGSVTSDGNTLKSTTVNQVIGEEYSFPGIDLKAKEGYKFAGWFTDPTGGVEVTASDVYADGDATTFYAHWTPVTFDYVFDVGDADPYEENEGTYHLEDGEYQISINQTYDEKINFPSEPTRVGYTFDGWYTGHWDNDEDCAVFNHKVDSSTIVSYDLFDEGDVKGRLFAKWSPNTYEVTFDANGAYFAGNENITTVSEYVTYGETFEVPYTSLDVTDTMEELGYEFTGWYTEAIGGTSVKFKYDENKGKYVTTDPYSISDNTTYYAHWENRKTYRVEYYSGKCGKNKKLAYDTPELGDAYKTLTIKKALNYFDLTDSIDTTGYTFLGWSLHKNSTTVDYPAGKLFTDGIGEEYDETVKLYAVWALEYGFVLSYDGNGYDRSDDVLDTTNNTSADDIAVPADQDAITIVKEGYVYSTTVTNVTTDGDECPVRVGYEFLGWSTSQNGVYEVDSDDDGEADRYYTKGDVIKLTADTVLYAQWRANAILTYRANGGVFENEDIISDKYYKKNTEQDISSKEPVKVGYKFVGWSTKKNDVFTSEENAKAAVEYVSDLSAIEDDEYYSEDVSETIKIGEDNITLYAVWLVRKTTVNLDFEIYKAYNFNDMVKEIKFGDTVCDEESDFDKSQSWYSSYWDYIASEDVNLYTKNYKFSLTVKEDFSYYWPRVYVNGKYYKFTDMTQNDDGSVTYDYVIPQILADNEAGEDEVAETEIYIYDCSVSYYYITYVTATGKVTDEKEVDGSTYFTSSLLSDWWNGSKAVDFEIEYPTGLKDDNYEFAGWYTSPDFEDDEFVADADGNATGCAIGSTVNPATKNYTLYAKWVGKDVKVTYDMNGGSYVYNNGNSNTTTYPYNDDDISTTYEFGKNVTLWAPELMEDDSDEGYLPAEDGVTLVGWSTKDSSEPQYLLGEDVTDLELADATTYNSTTDSYGITLYAVWDTKNYTVTFDGKGGTLADGNPSTVYKAAVNTTYSEMANVEDIKEAIQTAPIKEGYIFNGWKLKDAEGHELASFPQGTDSTAYEKIAGTSTKIKQTLVFEAQWTPITYKVNFRYYSPEDAYEHSSNSDSKDCEHSTYTYTATYDKEFKLVDALIAAHGSQTGGLTFTEPGATGNTSKYYKVSLDNAITTGIKDFYVVGFDTSYTKAIVKANSTDITNESTPSYGADVKVENLSSTQDAVVNYYVVWSSASNSKYLSYNTNGGSWAENESETDKQKHASQTYTGAGEAKTITSVAPSRDDYKFVGWTTKRITDYENKDYDTDHTDTDIAPYVKKTTVNGVDTYSISDGTTIYSGNDVYTTLDDAGVVMYAVWYPVTSYDIVLNVAGAATETITAKAGSKYTLSEDGKSCSYTMVIDQEREIWNSNEPTFTYPGHKLIGWTVNPPTYAAVQPYYDQESRTYTVKDLLTYTSIEYTPSEVVSNLPASKSAVGTYEYNLYAVWEEIKPIYVMYDPNGGDSTDVVKEYFLRDENGEATPTVNIEYTNPDYDSTLSDSKETLTNIPTRTKEGYTFLGWSTEQFEPIDESDVETFKEENEDIFYDVDTLPVELEARSKDLKLYAVWQKDERFHVTYDLNSDVGLYGYAPVDATDYYTDGDNNVVDVKFEHSYYSYRKDGYTFLGWATSSAVTAEEFEDATWDGCNGTAADEAGTKCFRETDPDDEDAEASFIIDEDTTLYAVWKANEYDIVYNGYSEDVDDAGYNNVEVDVTSRQAVSYGETATICDPSEWEDFVAPTGYEFAGWARYKTYYGIPSLFSEDLIMYSAGDRVKNLGFSDGEEIYLYAVYKPTNIKITYKDEFRTIEDKSVITGTEVKGIDYTKVESGEGVDIVINPLYKDVLPDVVYKDVEGYKFDGIYAAKEDGTASNVQYYTSELVPVVDSVPKEDTTLVAKYTQKEYTLKYMQGTKLLSTVTLTYDDETFIPKGQNVLRQLELTGNNKLLGWSTNPAAETAQYIPNTEYNTADLFSDEADVTLYAVVGDKYRVTYNPMGGYGEPEDTNGYLENDDVEIMFDSDFELSRPGFEFVGWSTSKSTTFDDVLELVEDGEFDGTLVAEVEEYEDNSESYVFILSPTFGKTYSGVDDDYVATNPLNPDQTVYYAVWKPTEYFVCYHTNNGEYDETYGDIWTVDVVTYPNYYTSIDYDNDFYPCSYDDEEYYYYNDGTREVGTGDSVSAETEEISRTGYRFTGWSLASDSAATDYDPGALMTSPLVAEGVYIIDLYATWEAEEYTIKYDSNYPDDVVNTEGSVANQTVTYGDMVNLSPNNYQAEGCMFLGWTFTKNASDEAMYEDQEIVDVASLAAVASEYDSLSEDNEITLYAVWTDDELAIAKMAAIKEINEFEYLGKDIDDSQKEFPGSYAKLQELEIKQIIDEYEELINEAESVASVTKLKEDAEEEIDGVETELSLTYADEMNTLEIIKNNAIDRLDDFVDGKDLDSYDSRTLAASVSAVFNEYVEDIEDVKLEDYIEDEGYDGAFDAAVAEVNALVAEAKSNINYLVVRAREDKELEELKEEEIYRIIDYVQDIVDNYVEEGSEEEDAIVDGLIEFVDDAYAIEIGEEYETYDDAVMAFYDLCFEYFLDLVDLKASLISDALEAAKVKATGELAAYLLEKDSEDYSQTDRANIKATAASGTAVIEDAETVEEVNFALVDAKRAIDSDVSVAEDNLKAFTNVKNSRLAQIAAIVSEQKIDELIVNEEDYAGAIEAIYDVAVDDITSIELKDYADTDDLKAHVQASLDVNEAADAALVQIYDILDEAHLAELKSDVYTDVVDALEDTEYAIYDYEDYELSDGKTLKDLYDRISALILSGISSVLEEVQISDENTYKDCVKKITYEIYPDALKMVAKYEELLENLVERIIVEEAIDEAKVTISDYAENKKSDDFALADNNDIAAASAAAVSVVENAESTDEVKIAVVDAKREIDAIVAEARNRVSELESYKASAIDELEVYAKSFDVDDEDVLESIDEIVADSEEFINKINLSTFEGETGEQDLATAKASVRFIVVFTEAAIDALVQVMDANNLEKAKEAAKQLASCSAVSALEEFNAIAGETDITVADTDSDELKAAKQEAQAIIDDIEEVINGEDGLVNEYLGIIDDAVTKEEAYTSFVRANEAFDNAVQTALIKFKAAAANIADIINKEELKEDINAVSEASVERDNEITENHEADMAEAASKAAAEKAALEKEIAETNAKHEADMAEAASKAAAEKAVLEEEIADTNAKHEADMAEANAKHEADMAEAASKAAAEKAALEERIAETNAKHDADMAAAASQAAIDQEAAVEAEAARNADIVSQLQSENGNLKKVVDSNVAEIEKLKSAASAAAVSASNIGTIMKAYGVDQATATTIYEYITKNGISMDTLTTTGSAVEAFNADGDVKGSTFGKLKARTTKKTKKKSITVEWDNIADADGYEVYGAKAGSMAKNTLKAEVPAGTNKAVIKGLKKGKMYRFIVLAYKTVGGKKITVAISKTVYDKTKGGKKTRIKNVIIKKVGGVKKATSTTVAAGNSVKIVAKIKKANKKRKIVTKRLLSYESSNEAVATVAEDGTIMGVATGTCTVYVYAQNGLYKEVQVTVQ